MLSMFLQKVANEQLIDNELYKNHFHFLELNYKGIKKRILIKEDQYEELTNMMINDILDGRLQLPIYQKFTPVFKYNQSLSFENNATKELINKIIEYTCMITKNFYEYSIEDKIAVVYKSSKKRLVNIVYPFIWVNKNIHTSINEKLSKNPLFRDVKISNIDTLMVPYTIKIIKCDKCPPRNDKTTICIECAGTSQKDKIVYKGWYEYNNGDINKKKNKKEWIRDSMIYLKYGTMSIDGDDSKMDYKLDDMTNTIVNLSPETKDLETTLEQNKKIEEYFNGLIGDLENERYEIIKSRKKSLTIDITFKGQRAKKKKFRALIGISGSVEINTKSFKHLSPLEVEEIQRIRKIPNSIIKELFTLKNNPIDIMQQKLDENMAKWNKIIQKENNKKRSLEMIQNTINKRMKKSV